MKTILWLHGLNCTPRIFNHLRSQLPKHDAILPDYDSSRRVDDNVEQLTQYLPHDRPFTIIGHSLGGILGYLLVNRASMDYTIDHLISISTPFGGSDTSVLLSWLFPSYKVLSDMSPRSNIVKQVSQEGLTRCQFTSLLSTVGDIPFISEHNDGVVSIRSQEATKADRLVRIEAGHFEIMQDPQTVETVRETVFGSVNRLRAVQNTR